MKLLPSILLLMTSSLCFAAIYYGRVQSATGNFLRLQKLGISMCDNIPCFATIIPDVTEWRTAQLLLRERGVYFCEDPGADEADGCINIMLDQDGNETKVKSIEILFPKNPLTLAELAAYWGTPCDITIGAGSSSLSTIIYNPYWYTLFLAKQPEVREDELIDRVVLVHESNDCNYPPWLGFVSHEQYKKHPMMERYLNTGTIK